MNAETEEAMNDGLQNRLHFLGRFNAVDYAVLFFLIGTVFVLVHGVRQRAAVIDRFQDIAVLASDLPPQIAGSLVPGDVFFNPLFDRRSPVGELKKILSKHKKAAPLPNGGYAEAYDVEFVVHLARPIEVMAQQMTFQGNPVEMAVGDFLVLSNDKASLKSVILKHFSLQVK